MDEQSPYLPDSSFDRYARLVRRVVDVPVALVSLVEPDRQVFPGAIGLPEPYQRLRQTPLSHSFCQYVVLDREPLVVVDARLDDRLRDNLAIPDLGVVAYAGFPVTDDRGEVVGSLCAIDGEPRHWSPEELEALADLADACSAELAQRRLKVLADERLDLSRRARAHAELLLAFSESLTRTRTIADVVHATVGAARRGLGCLRAGIWLRPTDDVLNAPDGAVPGAQEVLVLSDVGSLDWESATRHAVLPVDDSNPLGRVLLSCAPVVFEDLAAQSSDFPHLRTPAQIGEARAYLPLQVAESTYGVLVLLWEERRAFDDDVRSVVAALASYCALAVQRALLLQERVDVGVVLQQAMLPELPQAPGVLLSPLYRPAAARNQVGGDWFDAVVLPGGAVDVVVGDVVGHDIAAAAAMGRIRNMLTTLVWDRPDSSPAEVLQLLDRACADLGVARMTTLVHGRLEPAAPGSQLRQWCWSNAGHPPPVLVPPDGPASLLVGATRELVLGLVRDCVRTTSSVDLVPGSVVLLYSDGLVETADRPLSVGLDVLLAVVERHRGLDLDDMVLAVADDMLPPSPHDDVAMLALQVLPTATD